MCGVCVSGVCVCVRVCVCVVCMWYVVVVRARKRLVREIHNLAFSHAITQGDHPYVQNKSTLIGSGCHNNYSTFSCLSMAVFIAFRCFEMFSLKLSSVGCFLSKY